MTETTIQKQSMTGWYDPSRLLSIGIRVGSSTVFGRMFDRRELIASLDPFANKETFEKDFAANFSFDAKDDFWLDYCADTGDGWNSTYAVARLLARAELMVLPAEPGPDGEPANTPPHKLPRAKVLVFGGDEVYPTPSAEDYRTRLRVPFDEANKRENNSTRIDGARLYALPGNHDWYDGLTAFTTLFCNRHTEQVGGSARPPRNVCGRQTRQTRPYFALKLPQNWWLCGLDIQLDGYLDSTQLSFFDYVAQELMPEGANIILCVGQPVWTYSRDQAVKEFNNYGFASLIVSGGFKRADDKPTRRHKLRLVLTGDAHHYAHFTETSAVNGNVLHYLTAGLGGAFLHPTHWLQDTAVTVRWPAAHDQRPHGFSERDGYKREFKKGAIYPNASSSWWLALRNLVFVLFNWKLGVFLGFVGLFSTWLLHFGSLVLGSTLTGMLRGGSWLDATVNFGKLLIATPWPILIILGIIVALIYLSDFPEKWPRWITGGIHAVVQILAYCVALLVVARCLPDRFASDPVIIGIMAVFTGIVTPSILGIYFLISLNLCHRHWNEAFSSLRIENHKGFLRLRIGNDGKLTVYPIVIDTVPHGDDTAELKPKLAEKPIELAKM